MGKFTQSIRRVEPVHIAESKLLFSIRLSPCLAILANSDSERTLRVIFNGSSPPVFISYSFSASSAANYKMKIRRAKLLQLLPNYVFLHLQPTRAQSQFNHLDAANRIESNFVESFSSLLNRPSLSVSAYVSAACAKDNIQGGS